MKVECDLLPPILSITIYVGTSWLVSGVSTQLLPSLYLRMAFLRASFSLVHTYADQLTQSPRFKFYKVWSGIQRRDGWR